MRSSLVISIVLLAAMLAGSFFMSQSAYDVSEEYAQASQKLTALTYAEQWEEAALMLADYQKEWEKDVDGMQLQVLHDDTDDVTLALLAIDAGVQSRSVPLCLWGCNELKESARHLYHRDKLSWGNVI